MLPTFFLCRVTFDSGVNPGANASWKLHRIGIRSDLPYGDAILAQEERERQWALGLALAVMAALIALSAAVLAIWPDWMLAAVLALLVITGPRIAFSTLRSGTQAVEIRGKAAEWRAAVRFRGADEAGYLHLEALSLRYYDQFKRVPLAEIEAALRAEGPRADRWLDRHWPAIADKWASRPPVSRKD